MIKYDPTFIKRFTRTKGTTPILFFHSFNEAGEIEYQGFIFRLRPDGTGVGYLFDWILGEQDDEHFAFTKAFLETCHFYTTDHEWRNAYRHQEKEDVALRQTLRLASTR